VDATVADPSVQGDQAAAENGALGDKRPRRRRWAAFDVLRAAAYVVAALVVSLLVRFRTPGIPGLDSYYHFRHADLYLRYGLWMKEFPWLVYSTINEFSGDIGYGFHAFLMPLALLPDEVLGMKLAAAVETAVVLVVLYLVLRRHGIPYAFAWPFYLLFLAPPITYTFIMTRPQTLTMGFAALLLSFMVKGPALGVLLASFALATYRIGKAEGKLLLIQYPSDDRSRLARDVFVLEYLEVAARTTDPVVRQLEDGHYAGVRAEPPYLLLALGATSAEIARGLLSRGTTGLLEGAESE
jgi:hypothetical protein